MLIVVMLCDIRFLAGTHSFIGLTWFLWAVGASGIAVDTDLCIFPVDGKGILEPHPPG